jgi:multiple sugar transport system permease protein
MKGHQGLQTIHRKKRFRFNLAKLTSYALLLFGAMIMILPMFYMVISSLKDNDKTFLYPPVLFPKLSEISFTNYRYILENSDFFRYLLNTIFVSLMTVLISIVISTLLAYSFARLRIPGKKIFYGFIISIMLLPGLALIIPQFELAARLGLINKIWGVILFYSAWVTPFSTFLLRGYIEDNIPTELDESIFIDGGSVFSVYRYIILPMASPAIASISILNFLFPFEELGWSQAILKIDSIRTLPVAITMFFQAHNRTDWGFVFAITTLAMIPVICFYLLLQKYFISGLTSGAVKG